MKRFLYIVNPISGKGSGRKVVPLIKSLQNNHNQIEIIQTKSPLHATDIVRKLIKVPDVIISVGGDGTLNEIINGIIDGAQYKICVLPVGSGNDFIKNFKFGKNIKDILSFIHNQDLQNLTDIDIAEILFTSFSDNTIKSHKFVNSAGIGFDAQVGYLKQSDNKFSGILSYIYSVIKALFDYKMIDTEILFNSKKISGNKLMISIGNGISSGGGFYLNPNAIINDGLLDLSIFDEVTRLRLLTALPMALVNKVEKIREAKLFRSDAFKIIMRTPAVIHCDGEIISTQLKTAEIKVRKNAIKFISKKI